MLFTVDKTPRSESMMPGEIADLLIADYGVFNVLNVEGGGSTSWAMADPAAKPVNSSESEMQTSF